MTRILMVDDDLNILQSFKRQLRGVVEIETCSSAKNAIELLSGPSPVAVVISDMSMPVMNGVDFLKEVAKQSPDTVRIMLTGNADQKTALRAINEGHVFRMLTKPVSMDELTQVIKQATAHYQLVTSERELLQKTLGGSVKVLTDILALVEPQSFGRSLELRETIRSIAKELKVQQSWDLELAAMLAPLGLITLPPETRAKIYEGKALSVDEKLLWERAPEVAAGLIGNIPRLQGVANIIRTYQLDTAPAGTTVSRSARIVRVILDYASLLGQGNLPPRALERLKTKSSLYDPEVLAALQRVIAPEKTAVTRETHEVPVTGLVAGQLLLSDIVTRDGRLLISAGNLVNDALIAKVRSYAKLAGVKEPILVDTRTPESSATV